MHVERSLLLSLLALCVLLGAGCGSPATDVAAPATTPTPSPTTHAEADATEAADEDHGDDHADEEATGHSDGSFAFGAPADASDADRTVAIVATDEMAFDPSTVTVRAGEVVTFEVTNEGQIPHDFTLGDERTQRAHERAMEEMGADMAHDDPNAMTLDPGETAAITWRFDEAGEVLYGCHQPGHYDAGMVGAVDVSS